MESINLLLSVKPLVTFKNSVQMSLKLSFIYCLVNITTKQSKVMIMIVMLKVLLTLTVIVFLMQKRFLLGNTMMIGAGMVFLMCSPQWSTFEVAGRELLYSSSTWEILLAVFLVMCLEYQLRTSGIVNGLMTVSRAFFKSDRMLLALMPAFLGFLPSLGGAIFSAPLVEEAGKQYNLSPDKKTSINLWFRHVWECTNPILPSLLLASQIAQVPVSALIINMLWVAVIGLVGGWFVYISPLPNNIENQMITDSCSEGKNNYRYLFLAAGPIVANFLLVVGFDFGPAMSMLIVVVSMALVLRMQMENIITMFRHAFDRKLLWGLIGILFFQAILKQTGIIADVALVLESMGIPIVVMIGSIAFLAGILTGSSPGFVAIAFPFVAAISSGNIAMAVVGYVAGVAGQMLSPAHLCLLVTLEYFKADFFKSLRPIMLMEIVILLTLSIKMTF